MSIAKRSLSGVLIGAIQFLLTLFQGVILVPIILSNWSESKYGEWLTIYAFINLMKTLDAGHQIYIANEFTKWYHINKLNANKKLGSAVRVAFVIGGLEFIIFILIVFFGFEKTLIGINLNLALKMGIASMLLFWWVFGSVGGIIYKIALPIGKYNRIVLWGIVNKILEIITISFALHFNLEVGQTFIWLAVVFFVYSVIVFIDMKKILPEVYPWWQYGSFKEGFIGFRNSIVLTLNSFVEQFSINGMILLITNFLNVSMVPVFTTMKTVTNVFLKGNDIVLGPIAPEIIKFHVLKQKEKIKDIINFNWFLINIVLLIPLILILPFLENIYLFWTKGTLLFNPVFCYSLVFSIIIISYGKVLMSYLGGLNHFKALLAINIVRIILLVSISTYLLIVFKSISYVGLAICFSEIFASFIIPLIYIKKVLKSDFLSLNLAFPLVSKLILFVYIVLLMNYEVNIFLLISFFLIIIIISLSYEWGKLSSLVKSKIIALISK